MTTNQTVSSNSTRNQHGAYANYKTYQQIHTKVTKYPQQKWECFILWSIEAFYRPVVKIGQRFPQNLFDYRLIYYDWNYYRPRL